MTQKKFFQLAVIAVATVWVFCITFAVAYTIRTRPSKQLPVNQQTPITTGSVSYSPTTPPTTKPTTSMHTTSGLTLPLFNGENTTNTAQPHSPGQTDQPQQSTPDSTTTTKEEESRVPKGKNNIINTYVNGINALKNTQNFSMNKNDTLDVKITDVQIIGGSALKNTVMEYANSIIAPPDPESYTFVEGKDQATGETPNSTIAPLNVAAQVSPDAVTEAKATQNSDGGYTVNLTLQAESQTMNKPAPNLSTMVEIIDVSALLPSGATLTDVNINYAPSTITAVFDNQNRIVAIEHKLTSTGGGSGKMLVNVTMSMEGTYTSKYSITYN